MKEIRIAKLNFFRWSSDPKYPVVILYMLLYSYEHLHGLAAYARDLGVPIAPWVLPFMPCRGAWFLPLMLGFPLLVADAPFRTGQQALVTQRTGKRAWLAGQLLYLLILSVGFAALMWVLSWLWLLPELSWSGEWGAALVNATINYMSPVYHIWMDFPYGVVKNTDPLPVTLWCAGAMAAVCYLLSVIVAACNLWLRKGWGTAILAIISAISLIPDFNVANPGPIRYILWLSPLNWMDYSLMGHAEQYLPSHAFAIWCPIALGGALSAVLLLTIGKCSVETEKE